MLIHSLLSEKCVMRSAKCVVVEGAHKIWRRPNTPFLSFIAYIAIFMLGKESVYLTRRHIVVYKRGIGVLYELCTPSTITHYALRITHCLANNYLTIYIPNFTISRLSWMQIICSCLAASGSVWISSCTFWVCRRYSFCK